MVFVLFYLGGRDVQSHMLTLLALSAEAAVHNLFVWQIFTYMFLHGGSVHLLFNMLALWLFGLQLEQDWGTRRFLKYYFYCGMAAGVCVLVFNIAAAALTGNPDGGPSRRWALRAPSSASWWRLASCIRTRPC